MKLKIEIPARDILEGMPEGKKTVEIEVESPAETVFQMQRRGCDKDYIHAVLGHLAQVWGKEFPAWYGRPDKEQIQKDLTAVHGAYGYDGPRYD